MFALGQLLMRVHGPTLFSRVGDVEALCAATDDLALRLVAMKVGAVLIGAICVVQALAIMAAGDASASVMWAAAGFLCVTLARVAWTRIADARVSTCLPGLEFIRQFAIKRGIGLVWLGRGRGDTLRASIEDPLILHSVRGALGLRPDSFGRWAGHWGCFTRAVPALTLTAARPAEASDWQEAWPAGLSLRGDPRAFLVADSGPRSAEFEEEHTAGRSRSSVPLSLEGAIFGENRGRRTLRQLRRRGELSFWLTVGYDRAVALANEAWGRDPGIPRDQKIRLAFLAAVYVVDRYGLDARLLKVTRAVRIVLRAANLGAPGLAGGESATWIRDMVKGQLASFERELAEAANRLERNGKN